MSALRETLPRLTTKWFILFVFPQNFARAFGVAGVQIDLARGERKCLGAPV